MYNGGAEEIKGIISNFKKLSTKIQPDSNKVKKERMIYCKLAKRNIKKYTMKMKR